MDSPSDQTFYQLLHLPQRCHPGTVDGLLAVDDIGARIERAGISFPDESDLSPFPRRADGELPSGIVTSLSIKSDRTRMVQTESGFSSANEECCFILSCTIKFAPVFSKSDRISSAVLSDGVNLRMPAPEAV